jgi:E3 ubiquitin-protein ligase UBR7
MYVHHSMLPVGADQLQKFDKCTHDLGSLRQSVFACITCCPPPASAAQLYTSAGVCYSCSISCHGEHTLVELFNRRDFVCDCGTTRIQSGAPCTIRSDPNTGNRGVSAQQPAPGNHYNHNYQNRFCACGEEYDAHTEKGTMFQCLGLGTVETGGCGEDWYHPECLMGLSRNWYQRTETKEGEQEALEQATEEGIDHPVPPGFPGEDDFEALICYKCVESNPWIKQYASTPGFLDPVFKSDTNSNSVVKSKLATGPPQLSTEPSGLKRKASDSDLDEAPASPSKRVKDEEKPTTTEDAAPTASIEEQQAPVPVTLLHKHDALPPSPEGTFSLFLKADFREHLCHCPKCYPNLIPHPQLTEEEEAYEPSISDSNASGPNDGRSGTHSHGTASLLDRGEAALSTMDRVKAIEGVMVYNHLRDKVKEFLKPYAESGKAVAADDIKAYFEKLRGDEKAIKEAGAKPTDGDAGGSDNRRQQSGY